MSKLSSQEAYERAKARHKEMAQQKVQMIQEDIDVLRTTYVPKYLKRKFITGCALFGVAYLAEELLFRKKVPGIVKFTGALAATVMAPKVYTYIQENYLSAGDISVIPVEPLPPARDVNEDDIVE